ncbi:MAG: ribonuclease III [Balneolaceae bacterium]|nr:MAG: ribonuclease III [Balneolaceae bacterium]
MIRRLKAYFYKRSLDPTSLEKIMFIEKLIGELVDEPDLYLKALRHRSSLVDESLAHTESYEQLEFLGDAVLDLIVTELIFRNFPQNDEGFMTKLRSKLVKEPTLASLANEMGLPQMIEVGKRVRTQGIEQKDSVLSDIFEAVIGALYKDKGFDWTAHFVIGVYEKYIDLDVLAVTHDNFKSILLELTQAQKLSTPEYRVMRESGPDHNKTFVVGVYLNGTRYGQGEGKNKKRAEQIAAAEALKKLSKS